MASITLKNIPEDLLDALRKAAEGDRRSLNQEILHLLAGALEQQAEPQAQLRAWRKLAGRWESDLSPTEEAKRLRRGRHSRGREVDL